MRDLYDGDSGAGPERWGLVQALGISAEYGLILAALRSRLESSGLRQVPGLREALMLPAALAAKLLGSADIYAAMLEDLPNDDNFVAHDPETQTTCCSGMISRPNCWPAAADCAASWCAASGAGGFCFSTTGPRSTIPTLVARCGFPTIPRRVC